MRVGDGYSAVRHAPVVGLRGQAVGCVRAEDGRARFAAAPMCRDAARMASAELAKLSDLVNFLVGTPLRSG